MEASDRTRICDHPPGPLPLLVLVDMTQHEGVAFGVKQRSDREFMIEARHRDAVLGCATIDRAVRHTHRPDSGRQIHYL